MLVGDEADILALRLGSGAKAQVGGNPAHLGLGHTPERKQQTPQHSVVEHVQHIGLILRRVGASPDPWPIGSGNNTGMVTGSNS